MDIKFSPNLFLEVAELNRFKRSMVDDGYKKAIKCLARSFGVVRDKDGSYFKTILKSGRVITLNPGLAFDANVDCIVLENPIDFSVPTLNDGEFFWLIVSHATTHNELGTVSINSNGSLSGVGTEFLSVLRGQANFPTKVKFSSTRNVGDYEVVEATSDTTAVLAGDFVAESNLKYQVIGAFTPGFQPADDDRYLYNYDSCNVRTVVSEDEPQLSDNEFIVSRAYLRSDGGVEIDDYRIKNLFSTQTYAQSDVVSQQQAVNKMSSLVSTKVKAVDKFGITMELLFNHGYVITDYDFFTTTSSNVVSISAGYSNFLGNNSNTIPNNFFDGWYLLNRTKMKYSQVSYNEGKRLYFDEYDSEVITISADGNEDDMILVPPFLEIEYMVKLSNNCFNPSQPYYFRSSLQQAFSRENIRIDLKSIDPDNYDYDVEVELACRVIKNDGKFYPFYPLAIAQFDNVNKESETLGDSKFNIDMENYEPEVIIRNYS